MTNRILLVLFLLNLLQLGYAQHKVKPSLAKGTFSRQVGYGMLNGSIVGGTTLLFGSALSFESAEKSPFWVGATLGTSTAIGWYLMGTEGCCRGIFKAYSDAGNDPDYQGSRWLTRLAVGLSTPVMLTGIAVGLSSELIGPAEGLDPKIGIPVALSSLAIPSVLGSLTYNMTRKFRKPEISVINSNRNAVYFELGGNALNSSLNYEYFIKHDLPIRLGLGYISNEQSENFGDKFSEGQELSLIPLTLSKLMGSKKHKLELGAGVTYGYFHLKTDLETEKNGFLVTGVLGYRYQPSKNGFLFRLSYTPGITLSNDSVPPTSAGISCGYAF